jgi:hypothetical protein
VALAVLTLAYRTVVFRMALEELVAPCPERAGNARPFEVTFTILNEFRPPSNQAPWCTAGQYGGRSVGDGVGTIGTFSYTGDWCIADGTLRGEGEVLATDEGEIYMSEVTRRTGDPGRIEALLRRFLGPPIEFEGVFTITGGTGTYEGVVGKADLVGRQLGGGRTAVAACGEISY